MNIGGCSEFFSSAVESLFRLQSLLAFLEMCLEICFCVQWYLLVQGTCDPWMNDADADVVTNCWDGDLSLVDCSRDSALKPSFCHKTPFPGCRGHNDSRQPLEPFVGVRCVFFTWMWLEYCNWFKCQCLPCVPLAKTTRDNILLCYRLS